MAEHEQQALATVSEAMARHPHGIVGFSGGKESLVLRHLLQPWFDRLEFVWVNTGAMFPHMRDFILQHGATEVHSNQAERFSRVGLPSRIVPIHNTPLGMLAQNSPPRLMLTDWLNCCSSLRARPLIERAWARGATLYMHGQRAEDGCTLSQLPEGLEGLGPLHGWSEAQVYEYLDRNSIELPAQYGAGYRDSGECWNCTAELGVDRLQYLAAVYPDLWRQLKPVLWAVYGEVTTEWNKHREGLDMVFAEDAQ
jgi:3'-phosphoadenosine 5'-phosphosulfate sulfotransferase (PAPS reductase)/FAD synthetase